MAAQAIGKKKGKRHRRLCPCKMCKVPTVLSHSRARLSVSNHLGNDAKWHALAFGAALATTPCRCMFPPFLFHYRTAIIAHFRVVFSIWNGKQWQQKILLAFEFRSASLSQQYFGRSRCQLWLRFQVAGMCRKQAVGRFLYGILKHALSLWCM